MGALFTMEKSERIKKLKKLKKVIYKLKN